MAHHETNIRHRPMNANEILSDIARSNEFLLNKQRNRDMGGASLLALSATQMAERQTAENKGYQTPETLQRHLVGALPQWLSVKQALDSHQHDMTRQERRTTLEPVVEFNHILREMIDNEVYTTMPEVVTFAETALLGMRCPTELLPYAEQELRATLDGMRHEIATESVLADLPDVYDVHQGDGIDDELRGRDVYVTLRDGREFAFDVKSRQAAANKANTRAWLDDYTAVWSGFTWEDFGNNLIPNTDVIAAKRDYWADQLASLTSIPSGKVAI